MDFADIADLGYEQARDELIEIVARLEAGQTPLEDSMRLWQRGEALAEHCSSILDGAAATLGQADGPIEQSAEASTTVER